MPSTNKILSIRKRDPAPDPEDAEDARALLGSAFANDDHHPLGLDAAHDDDDDDNDDVSPRLRPSRRQSPIHAQAQTQAAPPRTPRTTNRVRFDLAASENENASTSTSTSNRRSPPSSGDEEERGTRGTRGNGNGYLPRYHHHSSSGSTGQRAPLLTDIEAPSVTVANNNTSLTSLRANMEEVLEDVVNRPKSGQLSAFMNMANSIMYVRRGFSGVEWSGVMRKEVANLMVVVLELLVFGTFYTP